MPRIDEATAQAMRELLALAVSTGWCPVSVSVGIYNPTQGKERCYCNASLGDRGHIDEFGSTPRVAARRAVKAARRVLGHL